VCLGEHHGLFPQDSVIDPLPSLLENSSDPICEPWLFPCLHRFPGTVTASRGSRMRWQKWRHNGSGTFPGTSALGVVSVTAGPRPASAERVAPGGVALLSEAADTTIFSWAPIVADGRGSWED